MVILIEGGAYQGTSAVTLIALEILDYDNWHAYGRRTSGRAEYCAALEAEVERLKCNAPAVHY